MTTSRNILFGTAKLIKDTRKGKLLTSVEQVIKPTAIEDSKYKQL